MENQSDVQMASTMREIRKLGNIALSLVVDRDFYESLDRFQATSEFADIAQATVPKFWRLIRAGVWTQLTPPNATYPIQGWKIHVSANLNNAKEILRKVCAICGKYAVGFKFSADTHMLILMNSRRWGRGASGKFITIYPHNIQQFKQLLEDLYHTLIKFDGPYILSDNRYKDSKVLYYRYGGISPMEKLDYDGSRTKFLVSPDGEEIEDLRHPFYFLNDWVKDPFSSTEEEKVEDDSTTLKDGRYIVIKALSFSNSGGVYLGIDTQSGEEVIIKEARPNTDYDLLGNDAIKYRQKEWRLLNKLKETNLFPKPIDIFWDWEHLFLVQTLVIGKELRTYVTRNNPIIKIDAPDEYFREYHEKALQIGINLARGLQVLHENNVVLGDISASNVIIDEDTLDITFIDVEGTYDIDNHDDAFLFSPGFTSDDRRTRVVPTFEDDYYGLGGLLLCLLHLINTVIEIKPGAHLCFIKELQADFQLPEELVNIILSLMQKDSDKRPKPQAVVEQLSKITIRSERLKSVLPIPEHDIQNTLDRSINYIHSVASYNRNDRLFPSDSLNPNPLNISHGALGIAYALKIISGDVPKSVVNWIFKHDQGPDRYPPGLYVGMSGNAWAMSEIGYTEAGIQVLDKASSHPLLFKSSDVYTGVSGYGLTNLYFWVKTQQQKFLDAAVQVGDYLLETKIEDSRGVHWLSPEGSILIGYARGASGIALYLLYLYLVTGEERYLKTGRDALLFDISHGVTTMAHNDSDLLSFPGDTVLNIVYPYWFRGSAGVGTTLLRYIKATNDETLRTILYRIIPDTFRKYAIFPGLYNGLAGLGNFLLDCHYFLQDSKYLLEANKVASGIRLFEIEKPGGNAYPGDNLHRISTDFGTGSAGISLFLHRLIHKGENPNFTLDNLLIK